MALFDCACSGNPNVRYLRAPGYDIGQITVRGLLQSRALKATIIAVFLALRFERVYATCVRRGQLFLALRLECVYLLCQRGAA
jgi:hypothetical protein